MFCELLRSFVNSIGSVAAAILLFIGIFMSSYTNKDFNYITALYTV